MEKPLKLASADVFLACVGEKYYSSELIIQKTALIRVISGEMQMVTGNSTLVFRAGDTALFPRNQVAKLTKYPTDGQPYKSACIYFTQAALQQYYRSHQLPPQQVGAQISHMLTQHPLLESLFDSLLPYFTLADALPIDVAALKVEEAITILRAIDPQADAILGHFEEPGKIDLTDFMEQHYTFNLPAEKFGYLTGRSLTSFKRDFKQAFHTTPQKWLTRKRLELAHYLLVEKNRKPADVYVEAGFENLSHFSFAFKKQFGYSPRRAALSPVASGQ